MERKFGDKNVSKFNTKVSKLMGLVLNTLLADWADCCMRSSMGYADKYMHIKYEFFVSIGE